MLTLCVLDLQAQNTWFKFIPGWIGMNCHISKDTIYSFSATSKIDPNTLIGFNLNKASLLKGITYSSDSLFYFSEKSHSYTNLEYRSKNNSINLGNNNYLIAVHYIDSFATDTKWQSDLFFYPKFEKLNIQLNYDTFDTKIDGLFEINNIKYALVNWQKKIDKLSTLSSSRILKINDNKTSKLIYTNVNTSYNQNVHNIEIQNLIEDHQNAQNLIIQLIDKWDWHGEPAQFESVVQQIDTLGNLIWESRPSGNQDTINTSDFQMVQLPNGNILCSWLDLYYRPYKKPGDPYQFELPNYNATFWFAELDYQTGKRLWVKNNRQFLDWKMGTSVSDFVLSHLTDVLAFDDGIVWCGYRYVDRPYPQSWTALPYLFKTDNKGNPLWYREYNLADNDTTDKGFKPSSFIRTPDNGFLLCGEYLRKWEMSIDTSKKQSIFQTSALLKLDSNGCFTPGCNATDNIIKIIVPENNCNVYPNPANTFLIIEYPKGSDGWEILITDLKGKVVLNFQEKLNQISTANLLNGTYFIQLTNKKQYHYETHKITILH